MTKDRHTSQQSTVVTGHRHFLMNKNLQPCLACHSSQPCKPVPVGRLSMLSTLSWRCDREETKRYLYICKNVYFNCPVNTPVSQTGLKLNKYFLGQCCLLERRREGMVKSVLINGLTVTLIKQHDTRNKIVMSLTNSASFNHFTSV